MFSKYIKNTESKNLTKGATPCPRGWGARPTPLGAPPTSWASWKPSDAHLWLYGVFRGEKYHKLAHGMKLRRHEAEPWRKQSRTPTELFCRGNFPPGGGNHHHRSSHRERVNLHQHLHQHHLISNPSSSLVYNLFPKASDWYLWVASSVDYSL